MLNFPSILLLLAVKFVGSQIPQVIEAKWGTLYKRESGRNMSITVFRFEVGEKNLVARVRMSCNESEQSNPLLVVFRGKQAVLSLQVPTIVDNYEYSEVARTLCPFTNYKPGESFTVEVTSSRPVHYTMMAQVVENFLLWNNETRAITTSASEPVFLRYDIPDGIDSVVVHVESDSTVCMTVSVQKIECPVFDIPGNVNSQGIHQTMTRDAAIAVEKSRMSSFYVVFVINSDDDLCAEIKSIKPEKPTKISPRFKSFNVTIDSAMKQFDYILPNMFFLGVVFLITILVIVYNYCDGAWEQQFSAGTYARLEEDVENESNREYYDDMRMRDDDDLRDYDTLTDRNDVQVVRAKPSLTVADLSMTPYADREEKYNMYKIALVIIGIFYNITVVQLLINQASGIRESGNLDECTFNFRCARPFWYFVAFNNVISNGGYVYFGLLIIVMNYCRERSFKRLLLVQPELQNRYGLPQHSGLMTAIGLAVIMEGISSATYHVCPNNVNYQFDTALMYVIGMLGKLKIWSLRHPDMVVSAYHAFGFLGVFILAAIAGVYIHSSVLWITFSIIYEASIILISAEFYFKGQWTLNVRELRRAFQYAWASSKFGSCFFPAYKTRFLAILLLNVANAAVVLYGLQNHPKDFLSFLLIPFIGNLFIYKIYYLVSKLVHREDIPLRAWMLIFGAAFSWLIAGTYFSRHVSDWSKMPAISRELNQPCVFLNFFDNHDIWHLSSAFAIFFSFTAINVIDDLLIFVPRNTINVF